MLRTSLEQRLLIWVVLLGLAVPAMGADRSHRANPKLIAVAPFPALAAAAQSNHISLGTFDAASSTNTLQPGDSAAVLVTFVQKEKRLQWLLYFQAVAPKHPLTNKPAMFIVKSRFGPPQKFKSVPVAAELRLLGPFALGVKSPKAVESDAQFSLNQDFLGLGLDQAAALLARWSDVTNFPGAITSKEIKSMNPTPAEQRALCGVFPALFSYADIVQHTDGLNDLFFKLVELPSVWSMVRNVGVKMDFSFGNGEPVCAGNPADWNLPPSSPVYYFPWLMRLNNQPAMKVTLVVTSPQPPRLICGGVVAILAEKAGSDDTYMTLKLVSARHQSAMN